MTYRSPFFAASLIFCSAFFLSSPFVLAFTVISIAGMFYSPLVRLVSRIYRIIVTNILALGKETNLTPIEILEILIDFFNDFYNNHSEFIVYDNGYRSWKYTYRDVAFSAKAFSLKLRAANFKKGDKVIFWSENRPEWVIAFWGCLLAGVVVVPIDYQASSA